MFDYLWIIGYNTNMKKYFGLFWAFVLVFFTTQLCFAEEYKVLVLPDNLQFESTNYFIYPDSSVMFASDVIDSLNHSGKVKTVSMGEIRDNFRKNPRIMHLSKNVLKEYKYNYNICFVDLKTIAHNFSTNKVLLITSSTDAQNYLFNRTIWDFIDLPGEPVINPAYKLSTYAALIDVDAEKVLWQQQFQKVIVSHEYRMIAVNFAPATRQLEHIKSYSYFLSPMIARTIESKIIPPVIKSVNADIITTEVKGVQAPPQIQSSFETEIKTKPYIPQRPKFNRTMVNDL